jgi:hypothetical protein
MRRYALVLLAGLACRAGGDPADPGAGPPAQGQLTAEWQEAGTAARFSAPAEARWCVRDSSLEILAVRNDTGVGLALYARDSLRAEPYLVVPSAVYTQGRPLATGALRLVDRARLRGFESTGGRVEVSTGGSQRVSGRFTLRVKVATAADSLELSGRFDGLTVEPAAAQCGRAHKPGAG